MGKFIKKTPISVEQAVLILSTYDHYRSFLLLANDEGNWTAEALAGTIGIKPAAAGRILVDLVKKGLAAKLKEGVYTFRREGIIQEFPRAEIMPRGLNDRMRDYQAKMLSDGTLSWRRLNVLRADASELTAFYPVLSLSMSAAAGYGVAERTKHSAMFAIESKVVKLFDF
jgi:predicted transcriptional regulator